MKILSGVRASQKASFSGDTLITNGLFTALTRWRPRSFRGALEVASVYCGLLRYLRYAACCEILRFRKAVKG